MNKLDRYAGSYPYVKIDRSDTGVIGSDLGGPIDGTRAEQVVLHETGLARIPDHLSFAEAATLPCAAVTAWNALFEIAALPPGAIVLTLGTGCASTFAIQLAPAAGQTVIAP
jgi:NADPH:quinone reductase-like Zn-dependent oxidoreductase